LFYEWDPFDLNVLILAGTNFVKTHIIIAKRILGKRLAKACFPKIGSSSQAAYWSGH